MLIMLTMFRKLLLTYDTQCVLKYTGILYLTGAFRHIGIRWLCSVLLGSIFQVDIQ